MSKRDGRVMLAPEAIRPYFGKPPLLASDLLAASGWTLAQLQEHWCGGSELLPSTMVHPRSRVWGMGYAWSSLVCQSTMVAQCAETGLSQHSLLAEDLDSPEDMSLVAAIATDDVMIFSSRGKAESVAAAEALDDVLAKKNIERHVGKDVNGELNGVAIGIELEDGLRLAPNTHKLVMWIMALGALLKRPALSATQLHALLGVPHWFAQLNRSLYSVFNRVYGVCSLDDRCAVVPLPQQARAELLLFALLAPYLEAGLDRPWAEHVLATDAAPEYGFGLSVAAATSSEARKIGRLPDKSGWYVRMRNDAALNGSLKHRKGQSYRIHASMGDFLTLISQPKRYDSHSGELEAQALVVMARWLSRSPCHHAKRHAVLVDAKAVLGAAGRGRSSAPTLQRALRRLGAYVLASDIVTKYTYVPLESNPADRPSRGLPAVCHIHKRKTLRVMKVHLKHA